MAKIRVANAAPRFTNAEIWNVIRAKFPNFASHTSEGTAELFSERGFEALKQSDPTALNDFFWSEHSGLSESGQHLPRN